ncbi:hypothetical protein JHK82_052442 [Glycine max]|uniref:Aldehyde dehydrogenase family 2 member C4 n=1 Tax=Glycine soja TaxID=3848 RepID=A0A0B2R8J7_GLYSO|nr:hypothetical protein JHK85_053136 [Glycine max]KAG5082283.1 hypothetical protein JHK84_052321 [Glycine max]KAG5085045.1 hypothetical protein JHK82_052442 [Glycine max]KHN28489.1 Aldehyde dehydrogenase family 2 member C4 [Glycine soja]
MHNTFVGEVCAAGSRVLVQEGIYDEFEKRLAEKAKAWVVGDPFDPNVQQGPQDPPLVTYITTCYGRLTKSNLKKILSYIEHGKREEATLLTGGKRVGNKGYYIEPTIFSNVKVNSNSREIFCKSA